MNHHPASLGILVPWFVFSVAVALKLWRFAAQFQRPHPVIPTDTEAFRQALERRWANPR